MRLTNAGMHPGRINLKKFHVDIILPGTPVNSVIGFTNILSNQRHSDTHQQTSKIPCQHDLSVLLRSVLRKLITTLIKPRQHTALILNDRNRAKCLFSSSGRPAMLASPPLQENIRQSLHTKDSIPYFPEPLHRNVTDLP